MNNVQKRNKKKLATTLVAKMTEDIFLKKGNQEKKEKVDTFILQHLQHYRSPIPKIKPQNHNSCSKNGRR